MGTVVYGIAEGVQEGPEKVDYSKNLPKNKAVPENQIRSLRIARRMIGILSHFADAAEIPGYTYDIYGPVTLPERYTFGEVTLRFLPFWGKYDIVLSEGTIKMRVPQSSEEFEEDLAFINVFHAEYKKTSNGTRQKLLRITQNESDSRDIYPSGVDLFEAVMKRAKEVGI